ncbi:hypothetical protein M8C13_09075 [Crossiella sp. SN42]|uniref:hypothetical protein n=1 Tax=Crossiella sp. SN42 TaxID=2944808 RepID=UPI00207C71B2|nr:hypothetical protein [Crossiella sp. SN42]MCO1575908.1 hypothetical protein [Crossiella sp. SN42]
MLDIARDSFSLLVTGPSPLALDGTDFPGLPARRVALDEARDVLLTKGCSQRTRDAVWAHLITRARAEGAAWTVGAVGMALPMLTAVAARLSGRGAEDPADVCAEVLRGFLEAMTTVEVRTPGIVTRLRWAAHRAGLAAVRAAWSGPTPSASGGFRSVAPRPPWGHPDLVLARAVAEEVLTPLEAEVIGATRLEGIAPADWARAHDLGEWAVYKLRGRPEQRLLAYLQERARDDGAEDPVAAEVIDSLPFSPSHTTSTSSPSVAGSRVSRRGHSRRSLSKTGRVSGFQGCGANPSASASPEEPSCA